MSLSNFKIFAFADEADSAISGQIAAMQKHGLAGLEIRNVDGTNVADISVEKAREVRKQLEDVGLSIWSVGSPIGKINIETDDFSAHIEKFKHTLELSHVLGAQNIRLFSFYMPENKDPAVFKNEVIDRMGVFCDVAKGCDVSLCHENEKGIYGDNVAHCLEILQAHPALRCVFDPANFVQCGEDTVKAWEQLAPYVHYMHIKDAAANGDIVPAGTGIGQIPELLNRYREMGGTAITLEPHLSEFAGLSGLERAGEKSQVGGLQFASQEEAFAAGVTALKAIL